MVLPLWAEGCMTPQPCAPQQRCEMQIACFYAQPNASYRQAMSYSRIKDLVNSSTLFLVRACKLRDERLRLRQPVAHGSRGHVPSLNKYATDCSALLGMFHASSLD